MEVAFIADRRTVTQFNAAARRWSEPESEKPAILRGIGKTNRENIVLD